MNDGVSKGALLTIDGLSVDFQLTLDRLRAVDDVSFSIRAGSCFALVGESGSGKSTIAQAIQGILPKNAAIAAGTVELAARPGMNAAPVTISDLPRGDARMRAIQGARIATIFQEPMTALSPLHSIGEQIGETARLHQGFSKAQARDAVAAMLARVRFPDPKAALDMYPFELSGGLRQRAMIAMALIGKPDLLIADEPTTALDVTNQAEILALIRELQDDLKMTVLLITHDLGVVAAMAEDMAVLYRGRLMEAGPTRDLLTDPHHPYLKALLHAAPRLDTPRGTRLRPVREIGGGEAGFLSADQPMDRAPSSGPILSVAGLRKTFVGRRGGGLFGGARTIVEAVRGVDFQIARGECFGLVGESGCGKSTLSRLIMRATTPTDGAIHFDAGRGDGPENVPEMSAERLCRFRREAQYVFQDPYASLNPRMTVREILTEPLKIHGVGDDAHRVALAAELLALVGLDPRALARYPHSFSGGQRQRIGVARALALKPQLLLCDEPVSALDVSVQAQVLNLLNDLRRTLGLSYLFVTHNLAVVKYVADRVAVMCAGRIVELGPAAAVIDDPQHPYTRALLAAAPEPTPEHFGDVTRLAAARIGSPPSWPKPFAWRAEVEPVFDRRTADHIVLLGDAA